MSFEVIGIGAFIVAGLMAVASIACAVYLVRHRG